MSATNFAHAPAGIASFWADPLDDPRLDAIPDSIRNQIVNVADTLIAKGYRPTPQLVACVLERLHMPVEPDWVTVIIMVHWRFQLDELDPTDSEALRGHLEFAPVNDHPWCFYLEGLVTGLELPGRRSEPRRVAA